jgi:hypothetical protein
LTDGGVNVRTIPANDHLFIDTVDRVQRLFVEGNQSNIGSITKWSDFIPLYSETAEFNRTFFPDLWDDYIPIYNTVWRQSLLQPLLSENIHQDESVIHFGRDGYDSRMINLWVCLTRTLPDYLRNGELGIFIVDPDRPENDHVYDSIRAERTHFILKRDRQLVDNSHVGGAVLPWKTSGVQRRTFPFEAGTAVMFDSHLLHGTSIVPEEQRLSLGHNPQGDRTALTSVWVHKDDFNFQILDLDADSYEDLYLGIHDAALRRDLKKIFHVECTRQKQSLSAIAELAKHHIDLNGC